MRRRNMRKTEQVEIINSTTANSRVPFQLSRLKNNKRQFESQNALTLYFNIYEVISFSRSNTQIRFLYRHKVSRILTARHTSNLFYNIQCKGKKTSVRKMGKKNGVEREQRVLKYLLQLLLLYSCLQQLIWCVLFERFNFFFSADSSLNQVRPTQNVITILIFFTSKQAKRDNLNNLQKFCHHVQCEREDVTTEIELLIGIDIE